MLIQLNGRNNYRGGGHRNTEGSKSAPDAAQPKRVKRDLFRIALPLAVIGAVVGEWFSSQSGLGYVILVAHSNLHMPVLFSAILTLAVIGVAINLLTSALERRIIFWHDSTLTR